MEELLIMQKIDRALNDLPECKQEEIRKLLRELQLCLNGFPL